jgi:hypothetical protein
MPFCNVLESCNPYIYIYIRMRNTDLDIEAEGMGSTCREARKLIELKFKDEFSKIYIIEIEMSQ